MYSPVAFLTFHLARIAALLNLHVHEHLHMKSCKYRKAEGDYYSFKELNYSSLVLCACFAFPCTILNRSYRDNSRTKEISTNNTSNNSITSSLTLCLTNMWFDFVEDKRNVNQKLHVCHPTFNIFPLGFFPTFFVYSIKIKKRTRSKRSICLQRK